MHCLGNWNTNDMSTYAPAALLFPQGKKVLVLLLLFQCTKYKKRLLPILIHHFKTGIISNIDHTRVSGIEPSSVILSQT